MNKHQLYQTILPQKPWHFEFVPNKGEKDQNGKNITNTGQIYNKIFFLTGIANKEQQEIAQKLGLYTAPA